MINPNIPYPIDFVQWDDLTDEQKWHYVKVERTRRIDAIRWMLDDGVPITLAKRQAVLDYIQDLRDVPQKFSNPDEVTFPEAPTYG